MATERAATSERGITVDPIPWGTFLKIGIAAAAFVSVLLVVALFLPSGPVKIVLICGLVAFACAFPAGLYFFWRDKMRYFRAFSGVFSIWSVILALPMFQIEGALSGPWGDLAGRILNDGPPLLVHPLLFLLCCYLVMLDGRSRLGELPRRTRLGSYGVLLGVGLSSLLLLAGFTWYMSRPFSPSGCDLILDKLPAGQHEAFEENAYMKSLASPCSRRVDRLVTVFYEPSITEEWPACFVKVQLIEFALDGAPPTPTLIRARSSSSDDSGRPTQKLYHISGGNLVPVPGVGTGPSSDQYEIPNVKGGDTIAVVAAYDGPLIAGGFPSPDSTEEYRDWHQVEVSDLASIGAIKYLCGTGSRNYTVRFHSAYDFWFSRTGVQFNESPPNTYQVLADRLTEHSATSLQLVCCEAEKDFAAKPTTGGTPPQTNHIPRAFADLASHGLSETSWAIDDRTNQKVDRAYITWTNNRNY